MTNLKSSYTPSSPLYSPWGGVSNFAKHMAKHHALELAGARLVKQATQKKRPFANETPNLEHKNEPVQFITIIKLSQRIMLLFL